MNRIRFDRYAVAGPPGEEFYGGTDLVVPVVDGEPLFVRVGDRWPGLAVEFVAPPSRLWLGEPVAGLAEGGRTVILDGECGHAGCCGVFARVLVGDSNVRWDDFSARGAPALPPDLRFVFERRAYERALAGVELLRPIEWVAPAEQPPVPPCARHLEWRHSHRAPNDDLRRW